MEINVAILPASRMREGKGISPDLRAHSPACPFPDEKGSDENERKDDELKDSYSILICHGPHSGLTLIGSSRSKKL